MSSDAPQTEIQRRDDAQFQYDIEKLLREAEDARLSFMKKHRDRGLFSIVFGILSILAGAGGFGWFLLVEGNIQSAVLCMGAAIILPVILNLWTQRPIKAYRAQHKSKFMPKMAKALGGFTFHPRRGISTNILVKTGIVPPHHRYEAEDCFMGRYKGTKVIFSEARLHGKNKGQPPVFHGLFVVLEMPDKMIDGHTIITADQNMVRQYAGTRWKKLQSVRVESDIPDWSRFQIFSDTPDAAALLAGDKMQREFIDVSAAFHNAPIGAAFFKEKFIFLSIPHDQDMFEASDMYIPVATKQHALKCKKEIEKLLEIVDIFDLYKTAPAEK